MLGIQHNRYREKIEMSGFYKFKTDSNDNGEKEAWQKGLENYREIAVPASWNEQYQDLSDYLGTCWYERDEFIPAEWKSKTVMLRVGAASYYTKAWINGIFAGEYKGGSLPFEFDVTGIIKFGESNKITFSINAEPQPDRLPPGNFPESEWVSQWQGQYPTNNYDFYPYGGIHRPVYLYSLSKVHIEDIAVKTDVKANQGRIAFKIKVRGNGFSKVKVYIDNQLKVEYNSNGKNEADGFIIIDTPVLWDMENPHLYNFKAVLEADGNIEDEYTLPIGIRTITIEGSKLLLNGKPVFMKGFGKHEEFMIIGKGLNHALIIKDYNLMKWMGANSYRTSHYPYSEEMLDFADRNGFLVIDETPLVGLMKRNYNDECLVKCKNIIKELVDRDKNHPSVIMWSVANEPTSNELESVSFFKELYEYTKSLDDTRPVTMVTMYGSDEDIAIKYFDIICLNRYYGWYSHPGQLDKACEVLEKDLEYCNQKYQKPIMITEFGADAVAGMHYDPPRQFTEEYQAEMLTRQYDIMKSKDYIIGAHVWAFADFKTSQIYMRVLVNHKGVFTRDRQPKMAAHALRKLWNESTQREK